MSKINKIFLILLTFISLTWFLDTFLGIKKAQGLSYFQKTFTSEEVKPESFTHTVDVSAEVINTLAQIKTISTLDLSLNTDVIDFGQLESSKINVAQPAVIINISSLGSTGYNLYINDIGDNNGYAGLFKPYSPQYIIRSITGILSPNHEVYGVQAEGLPANIFDPYKKNGEAVGALNISPQIIADNSQEISDNQVKVDTKATIGPLTPAGEYSDQIYYTLTMKF